jgi:hypothetical protein
MRGEVRIEAQLSEERALLGDDGEFREARSLVFEFLGASVPVQAQPNGEAVLNLNLDPAPIFLACKAGGYELVAGVRHSGVLRPPSVYA